MTPLRSEVIRYTHCMELPGFPAVLSYVLRDLGFEPRPEYTISLHYYPYNMEEYTAEVKIHTRVPGGGVRLLRFTGKGTTSDYACVDAARIALTHLRSDYPEMNGSPFHYFPRPAEEEASTFYNTMAPEEDTEVNHLAWYIRSSDYCLRALRFEMEEARRHLRVLQAAVQPVLVAHGYSLAVLDGADQVGPVSPVSLREPSPPAPLWRYPSVPPSPGSYPFLPRFF